jgi:hypothetical protein
MQRSIDINKTMSNVEARYRLDILYKIGYCILPKYESPLDAVTRYDNASIIEDMSVKSLIKQFFMWSVHKHTGYNLDQFLSLPTHMSHMLIEELVDHTKKQDGDVEKFEEELGL